MSQEFIFPSIDRTAARRQLELLGYKPGDDIYLRFFYPSNDPRKNEDKGRKSDRLRWEEVEKYQSQGRGAYLVVNGGGHKDENVASGRAIFSEDDRRSKEEQQSLWQELGLPEPSLQIDSGGKSVHNYWIFSQSIPIDQWRALQADLLEFTGGDRSIKNPSRVMRLAGAWHISLDEERLPVYNQTRIISDSGKTYSYEELRSLVPQRKEEFSAPQQGANSSTKSPNPKARAFSFNAAELENLPKHPNLIQLPLPVAVPLEVCLSVKSRHLLNEGSGEGGRNSAGATLARDLLGTANCLNSIGQKYDGDPRQMLDDYNSRCTPPMSNSEVNSIWKSAISSHPQPSCKEEGVYTCVRAWYWRSHIKHLVLGQKAVGANGNGNGNGRGFDGGSNRNGNNNSSERNHWNAPVAYKRELGWWIEEKFIETDPSTGEQITVTIPKFVAQTNFDFEVERELSDSDGGGIVIQCQRSIDSYKRRVIVPAVDSVDVAKFTASLAKAYGSSIVCNLKKNALGALIHTKLVAYRERGGKTYKLADRQGQQEDGTWVFSDRQYTPDGELTDEEQSGIVYNPNLGGTEDKMPSPELASSDPQALPRLVDAMKRFLGESQIEAAIFVLGWIAAGVHYQTIQKKEGYFPLLNLVGEVGTGKSIMANSALSLVGWQGKDGVLHRASISSIYETLKMSGSLPVCLDDPERSRELDELLKGLYNAVPRRVRGNFQAPHAPLMITSNHACGDDHPATLSRLIQMYVYISRDGDPDAWDDLVEAQRKASGALPQLIKLGYPQQEIKPLRAELRKHLPLAHARVADSIGLVLWYASAIANLANFNPERIKNFVINILCTTANNTNSAQDSLSDFIDKLNALHSMSKIGEWDIRKVESTKIGTAIAIHMPSVWNQIDSAFNPSYSRKVIESLLVKQGGLIRATAQFHRSADESKSYYRYLTAPQHDTAFAPSPPEMVTRRCVLLPGYLAQDFIAQWKEENQSLMTEKGSPQIATDRKKHGDRLNLNIDETTSSVFSETELDFGDRPEPELKGSSSNLESLDHHQRKDIYINKNKQGETSSSKEKLNQATAQSSHLTQAIEVIPIPQMPQSSLLRGLEESPNCGTSQVKNGEELVMPQQSLLNSHCSTVTAQQSQVAHQENDYTSHSLITDGQSLMTEKADEQSLMTESPPSGLPTIEELVALLCAVGTLEEYIAISKKFALHTAFLKEATLKMPIEKRKKLDVILAISQPAKLFRYWGKTISAEGQVLTTGDLVVAEPNSYEESSSYQVFVKLFMAGWKKALAVHQVCLSPVEKALNTAIDTIVEAVQPGVVQGSLFEFT